MHGEGFVFAKYGCNKYGFVKEYGFMYFTYLCTVFVYFIK